MAYATYRVKGRHVVQVAKHLKLVYGISVINAAENNFVLLFKSFTAYVRMYFTCSS